MSVEIVNVPSQQPGPVRAVPTPAAPAPVARPWRAVAGRCVAVPLIVLLPLVALTPSADHRFNVYANGGLYLTHPWRMLRSVVTSVPLFLDLGNFRPLGRIVEWSLDTAAFALTALTALPVNITLRLVSFAAAIVLCMTVVLFAESVTARGRVFAGTPSVLVALLPFAVGAGLVAAGRTSTTVLFGGLYFLSSALVLAVAAWACRVTRVGPFTAILAVLTGAALAAFNEIAYLAVPLATAAVLLRGRIVLGRSWQGTLLGPGGGFAGLLWLGFLPVFLPVRALIYRACAHGGCYSGSDIRLPGAAAALPNRLVSWLPPLMWQRGTDQRPGAAILLLALLALTFLAVRAARQLPRLVALDRRQALGLVAVALVLLVLAGTLASLNSDVQALAEQGAWGQGWRDSGLTTAAGSVLLLALPAVARRRYAIGALAVLTVAGAVSTAVNQDFHDSSAGGRYPYLHDRIAQEVADFDPTPAGDARRCTLRTQFVQTSVLNHHGIGYQPEVERFDVSLDRASRQLAGRRFCSRAPR
ncbi:hypothetical protein ACWKSP_18790 [Micromonosporaceae bacterium Da 78-11]